LPLVFHSSVAFTPSHVCLAAVRIPNADLLADALSVLDRLRRSAGSVLRKWNYYFRKADGRPFYPVSLPAQIAQNTVFLKRRMTHKLQKTAV